MTLDGVATVQQAAPGTLTTESLQPGWDRGPQLARLTLQVGLQLHSSTCILPVSSVQKSNTDSDGSQNGGESVSSSGAGKRKSLTSSLGSKFGLPTRSGAGSSDGQGRQVSWLQDDDALKTSAVSSISTAGGRNGITVVAKEGLYSAQAAYQSAAHAVESSSELAGGCQVSSSHGSAENQT